MYHMNRYILTAADRTDRTVSHDLWFMISENNSLLTKFKIPTDEILPWPMTFPSEESSQQPKSTSQNLPGTSGLCREIMPAPGTVPGRADPYNKIGNVHFSGYNNYGNHYTYQNGSYYYSNRSYTQGYPKMHRSWPYPNHGKNPKMVRINYLSLTRLGTRGRH